MTEVRKSQVPDRPAVLDRRTALRVYVPPTLAAIGVVTATSHGVSGAGGGTTAPRNFAGVARDHGRGRKAR
jgi:hypothetical protein